MGSPDCFLLDILPENYRISTIKYDPNKCRKLENSYFCLVVIKK
jgi:hypothetical protein